MGRIAADAAKEDFVVCDVIAVKAEGAVPAHQRIIFVTKAKRGGELVRDPIAISNKPTELPFLSCCFDKLVALARSVEESEFELREGVKQVGSGAPIESRCAAAEVKLSAGP